MKRNLLTDYLLKQSLLLHQLTHLNLAQWDINVLQQAQIINQRQSDINECN
ncbi:hypothetical protein [Thalassotalea hakodatensis]|uniref:hypothetical protein n=1 Tax=Thalassotalea hakodatensis TaxID=3030492 RepID=UPI0025731187|nr:hypothetical protein [Thalassotalea hakodatensis]